MLLLDEPTNHLDDHGVEFLSGLVSTWRGPVLIASHDRAFLDRTVRSLIDLDPAPQPHRLHDAQEQLVTRGITRFTGTYSDFVQYRRALDGAGKTNMTKNSPAPTAQSRRG